MTTPPNNPVRDQIKLPARVAFQVVLQGMQIRFGRSLVTIMGVVLGIAFLMSILVSQVLKAGVAAEQGARLELQRMQNFFKAEIGSPTGKTLGVIQTGRLNAAEKRFLRSLVESGVTAFLGTEDPELRTILGAKLQASELRLLPQNSNYILVVGDGAVPAELTGVKRIATTQNIAARRIPAGIHEARLTQELRPEELAKLAAGKRKAKFRNNWIIIISLVVTVMGISNAMLMSVTERFREIGTMKCLGALSAFVRQLFLIESCLIGAVGGLTGSLIGSLFSIVLYVFTFGFDLVLTSLSGSVGVVLLDWLLAFGAGVILSVIAAIYPASVASRMVPANALRSNI